MKRAVLILVLTGCATETTNLAGTTGDDGEAPVELPLGSGGSVFGGSPSAIAEASSSSTAAGGQQTTVARVCEPGKQVSCPCIGGTSSIQACAADGMSWGECKCDPIECPAPQANSGNCITIGSLGRASMYDAAMCFYDQPVLIVNCAAAPRNGCVAPFGPMQGTPSAWCCPL